MKQRIITALILLIILIPILLIGGVTFNLAVLVIGVFGLKEMLDIRDSKERLPLVMTLLTFGCFIFFVVNMTTRGETTYLVDYRSIALIMFIMMMPIIIYHDNRVYNINNALFLIGTILFLGTAFNLLIMLRNYDLMHVIYLLVITMMTDTYALIGGVLVGKHKLLENISPKKTWGGFIVGTVLGVLVACVFYYITVEDSVNLFYLIIGTTTLSLIGQFGDLIFSSIKRLYNKKDFSNLMPGHGGILDRLDSFIFVLLAYTLFMSIL